ncbi:MAG TPA: ATP-binding SpoIIE family protein phosphatase [Flavisolibacter sp.]|nr:ATP-binding SpoIIE family protein phosphatase [Flavisolibacter sp.]
MVNRTHFAFKATDRSYFAILKKDIHALALQGNFKEHKVGEIDIIVSEMVSNLVKHAGGGQLLVKLIEEGGIQGIELISVDDGPGMVDVTRMQVDGVSTKNTLGHGLGAMKRLSDVFQIYSLKDWGTVILARVFDEPLPHFRKPPLVEIRSVLLPKPGEIKCGDGFFSKVTHDDIRLFLGDGLGHGPEAEEAVVRAGEAFLESEEMDPCEVIRNMNLAVKRTRGLVGTVAIFNKADKKWRICGVGNIITRVYSPGSSKNYMAYNGIIGLNVPNTLKSQEVVHEKAQYIVMCSDGIKSKWDTVKHPSLVRYDLSVLTATLLKDFARYTDDMSAAACKINI